MNVLCTSVQSTIFLYRPSTANENTPLNVQAAYITKKNLTRQCFNNFVYKLSVFVGNTRVLLRNT